MSDSQQPSITIYRGFPGTACYVWSPFVTKLEARLRFAGLTYNTEQGSPLSSPKGKIPYVSITSSPSKTNSGEKPEFLSDSQLISDQLTEQGVMPSLNAGLSLTENTLDSALKALLEDKLYFYNTTERWNDNYYTMRDTAMGSIPYPVRIAIGYVNWRQINSGLHTQGTGRFSADEIHSFRTKIWHDIENLLGEARHKTPSTQKLFWALGGEGPTEADTVFFGFIIGGLICDAGPVSQRLIRGLPNVVEYARRIHDQYFADYKAPTWE